MVAPLLSLPVQNWRPGPVPLLLGTLGLALACALAVVGPTRLIAQIEGDRGIVPVAASHDIQIDGVEVNVTGNTGEDARLEGWLEAARLAWAKAGGPAMGDGQIQSMVSSIVIQKEQIGPHRYIATLGVVFDRGRAGQFLAGGGPQSHSAPMLVIPVLYSGGAAQVYEVKGPWQAAWAQFRVGASPIDYVRPTGANGDSLLVTAGQPGRRSRAWWRNVLDQFGASDVVVPEARLERQWPGGPVRGTFTARYGPDNTWLGSFQMTASDEAGVPKMLAQAVVRLDSIYADALQRGLLKPDDTLNVRAQIDPALAALIAAGEAADARANGAATGTGAAASPSPSPTPTEEAKVSTFTIQFSSPDAAAVDAALGAVRGTAGVKGAATTSLAMGGTSLMKVSYAGELQALAAALRAKGWTVSVGNNALSIKH
ncbi:MAG: heavy-metal-associated domain-containing protein [Sphingomonadales bacterium]|nr:heavy-metal-associated domain-containing protein [Sphingomonadales bacterium]